MLKIDGSLGEGGGQILRTALSLSAITKKPVEIFNIRAKRENPGLSYQHLTAAYAVRKVCRGRLEGAELRSTKVVFYPGEIYGGKYRLVVPTAGSATLIAQTITPILLHANKPSTVEIVGGTHVMKSPTYDYFEKVFLPSLSLFNASIKSQLLRPGYFPKGGGVMRLQIYPSKLYGNSQWLSNETKALIRISSLPLHIVQREKKILLQNNIENIKVIEENYEPGNAVLIWKGCIGASVVGEKGKRAEEVVSEALDFFFRQKGDVDEYLADQLLIYAFLSEGKTAFSTSAITQHMKTNLEVISSFIERKFEIKKENDLYLFELS